MFAEHPDNSIAVLTSGGLDSAILVGVLLERGHRVYPVYIQSGLVWEPEEFQATRRYLNAIAAPRLQPLVTLQLPADDLYGSHWSITGHQVPDNYSPDEAVYLHGRNALLVVKAGLWCQLHGVCDLAIGVLSTNPFADASPRFFDDLQSALNYAQDQSVRIRRPFAKLNKRHVMELGRAFPLGLTFSCIAPVDGLHCGRCNKCAERNAAFRMIDVKDPTTYAAPMPGPYEPEPCIVEASCE